MWFWWLFKTQKLPLEGTLVPWSGKTTKWSGKIQRILWGLMAGHPVCGGPKFLLCRSWKKVSLMAQLLRLGALTQFRKISSLHLHKSIYQLGLSNSNPTLLSCCLFMFYECSDKKKLHTHRKASRPGVSDIKRTATGMGFYLYLFVLI